MPNARRALVIDDDEALRETIAQVLGDEGWDVEGASDGRAALARLRDPGRPLPDIILLDLMMPIMNGWEFRHEQRRDPRLASIPIVLMTASRALDHDVKTRLRKPYTVDELLTTLARVVAN